MLRLSITATNRGQDSLHFVIAPLCTGVFLYSSADRSRASRVYPPPDTPKTVYDVCFLPGQSVDIAAGASQEFTTHPADIVVRTRYVPGVQPLHGGRYFVSAIFVAGRGPVEMPVGDVVLAP